MVQLSTKPKAAPAPIRDNDGNLTRREKWSRAALVLLGVLVLGLYLIRDAQPTGPQPLDDEEKQLAVTISRQQHIPFAEAEAEVIRTRPSADDVRRYRAGQKRRDAEAESLHSSVCDIDPASPRC